MTSKRRRLCEADDLVDYLAMGTSGASLFKILSKATEAGETANNFRRRTQKVHAAILDRVCERRTIPIWSVPPPTVLLAAFSDLDGRATFPRQVAEPMTKMATHSCKLLDGS